MRAAATAAPADAAIKPITEQATLAVDEPQAAPEIVAPTRKLVRARKPAWPALLPERMKAVAARLAESADALTAKQIAASFDGRSDTKTQIPEIVATLVAFGRARQVGGDRYTGV